MKLISISFRLLYCFALLFISFLLFAKPTKAADDHILINEICSKSSCEGGEWIELFNPTDTEIDLSTYTLEDNLHKPDQHKLSGNIGAGEYKVILFSGLNDDGDCVILKNNLELEPVDMVFYGDYVDPVINNDVLNNAKAPETDESITRISGAPNTGNNSVDFVIASPTPGLEYLYTETEPEEEEILDIGDARELKNGEDVTIEGTVTALPGALSLQYFYIQDATGGIQIYCYGKNFPSMTVGDFISATGVLSESNNERRINIKTAENIIILNHTDPVVPEEITTSEIGEDQEGEYIKTVGIVTKTSGDTFYISDGIKEIKVVIRKTTGIDKPKMRKGDQVEVMGIVSQYKDEYRILPIDQDDVKIVASKNMLPRAGSEIYIYLIISLLSTLLWNIYLRAKKKLAT